MANRGDLSAEIQWLLQLAGTADFIEAIFDYLRDPESKKKLHVNREAKTLRDGEGKNRLLFFGGDAGHWVYCPATNDKSVVQWNSYELGHQKSGSHQFCQSFAQIYMLADLVGDKERFVFGFKNRSYKLFAVYVCLLQLRHVAELAQVGLECKFCQFCFFVAAVVALGPLRSSGRKMLQHHEPC